MSTAYRSSCDCGWTGGPYRSQAMADFANRKHSCEKQRATAERKARGEARRAKVDRTPKACLHKVANHQHGTYAAYVLDRCRCHPCTDARSAWESVTRRQKAYGRWNGYVDAQPARDHVRSLMDQSMGLKRIVTVSDVSQGMLWKLLYGKKRPDGTRTPSKRIRPDVEARILAVRVDLADGAVVSSVGSARRIQALCARGWSLSKIAERLGVDRANFTALAHGTRDTTVARAKAVADLYDELWNVEPPRATHRDKIAYTRALNFSAARQWAPPLAWDDESIDNPGALPFADETPVRWSPEKFSLDALQDCIDWGMDRRQAARRLGLADRSAIEQRCAREGRRDLLDALDRNRAKAELRLTVAS